MSKQGPSSDTHCMCCGNKVSMIETLSDANEKLREELRIAKTMLERAMEQLVEPEFPGEFL